jgi:hypothetical protein
LQGAAERGAEQHRVDWALKPAFLVAQGEALRLLCPGPARQFAVERRLFLVEGADLELSQPPGHRMPPE